MHDAGTVRHGDIAVADHIMGFFALLCGSFSGAGKQRLVFPVFQLCSLKGFQNLIGRHALLLVRQTAQNGIQQGLCHVIRISVCRLYLAVGLLRVHAERQVGGQGPGRGGPGQEVSVLSHSLKAHNGGTLLYGLIPLGHLLGGQGSAAAGTVGNHFKALVQKAFVPDLL